MVQNISAAELHTCLQQQPLLLLDVREDEEYAFCHIDGSIHIPMREIHGRLDELGDNDTVVTICHHGMRSLRVARFLAETGLFKRILNLSGGIDAWACEIDTGMPRY